MKKIFVYGTLKRGGSNTHYLAGQRFVGEARTEPKYRMYGLDGFPGLVEVGTGGLSVKGEIWEVDAPCLSELDRLEGVGEGLYRRCIIALMPPFSAEEVEGYLYLLGTTGRPDLGERFEV